MEDDRQQPSIARGVFAALLTPRRAASTEADTAILLDYLDEVTAAGVEGLVLFGSTGEFVHFDLEERARVAGLAIKRSRLPVLVNVSHASLPGAVTLAESAAEAGAAGLLLMPPYFYTYSPDQIFAFYEQFVEAGAARLPLYLYNLPMYTNPIGVDLAMRLFETGWFAGIKDSSGEESNLEALLHLRAKVPFSLLLGSEALFVRGRKAGVDGIVSGVAAALPELMVALDRAIAGNDAERVKRLDAHLGEFMRYVNSFPATVAIRQAATARGWGLQQAGVPLDEDTAAEVIAFHRWCSEWIPEVLAEASAAAGVRT